MAIENKISLLFLFVAAKSWDYADSLDIKIYSTDINIVTYKYIFTYQVSYLFIIRYFKTE